MIDPRVFLALPIKFGEVCTIYPPTVKEVLEVEKSLQYWKLLTQSQDDIQDFYNTPAIRRKVGEVKKLPTCLEFLLGSAYQSKEFCQTLKEGFKFFLREDVNFLYEHKIILIGDAEELAGITDFSKIRSLTEENFMDFQNSIRIAMGENPVEPPPADEDPLVAKMKAAGRRRERAALKSKKGISMTTSLAAICCMGFGLNPLNIGEISYASIGILTTLYQQKERYQIDMDSLMAGADPKKVKPKYWIREESDIKELKL